MRKSILLIGILVFHVGTLLAQSRQIYGKVTDAKDHTNLSGVTVSVKGSKGNAVSSTDGSFSIKVGPKATALRFTYIGYDDQEVAISASNDPLIIELKPAQKALSEVVVVGYGKAQKKDITGSIATVSAKDIENYPAPSFESAIQGKAPGVVVSSGSGKLGQGIQIMVRGISSISASSQPLYVIDGLPMLSTSVSDGSNDDTNPLTDINPNDIESVEILKDASSAAIYGARGANGVVLITTKKGKTGQKTTFELNTSSGISNPARKWKFLDAAQYIRLMRKAADDDGFYDFNYTNTSFASQDEATDYYWTNYYKYILDTYSLGTNWQDTAVNTNWQKQLFHHNAASNQINLSATGGNDKTRFFISGFYNTQDAIVINNRFTRYGSRFNIDHTASDRLTLGLNVAIDRSQLNRVTNDDAFSTPGQLVAQIPISPLKDPTTGLPNSSTLYPSGIFDALYDFDHQVTFRTIGNGYANLKIIPTLSFQSEFGTDILNLTENEFQGKESQDGAGIGKSQIVSSTNVSYNTNNYFTFTPTVGENHKLTAILGMSYLQNNYEHSYATGEGFASDAVKNLNGATNITSASVTDYKYTFLSYFLRANYSFKDKYLLSFSDRIDGSSRFSPTNRYGNFPAASVGWIMSEEDFLKNAKALSFLKLRASYGITGNSEIGESQYYSLYSVTNYPNLAGFSPSQLGSNKLYWEKSGQFDAGINFGFFKNRLTGEADVYHKHTTKLLLNTNIPATTGYASSGVASVFQNVGVMNNQGVELSLTSQNVTGAFRWTTTINIAYNKNRVGDLKGQIITSGVQRAIEGQPIGSFYMPRFAGVDPTNGDALYSDGKGGTTNDYSSAPYLTNGKWTPDWTGGITNTFSFKGVDLSIFFYGVTGNKIYNGGGTYMTGGFYNGFDNQTVDMMNAWTTPGQKTNVPRIGYNFGSGADGASTRWLYKGDYLRLKNLSLGYTLPTAITQHIGIKSARIYLMGTNLLTWTKYPGDPEVNTNVISNIAGGQDFYTIPQAKTYTLGLNVKF